MLNISFNTGDLHEKEARVIMDLLTSLFGAPAPRVTVSNAVNSVGGFSPAPDGYPTPAPAAEEDEAPADNAPGVDKDGVPWDERIHSSNRKLAATGLWMRRRGVEDDLYNRVTLELKGAAPTPPAPPEAANVFAAPPVPTPPPAPAATAPTPTPAGDTSFLTIMKRITAAQAAGKIDKAKLDGLLAAVGVESVAKLVAAPEEQRAMLCAVLDSEGL